MLKVKMPNGMELEGDDAQQIAGLIKQLDSPSVNVVVKKSVEKVKTKYPIKRPFEKVCQNPSCSKPFFGQFEYNKYCSTQCAGAVNGKKLAERNRKQREKLIFTADGCSRESAILIKNPLNKTEVIDDNKLETIMSGALK